MEWQTLPDGTILLGNGDVIEGESALVHSIETSLHCLLKAKPPDGRDRLREERHRAARTARTNAKASVTARWLHEGVRHQRASALRAMRLNHIGINRQRRYLECGVHAEIRRIVGTDKAFVSGWRCRDRFCPTCTGTVGRVIGARLAKLCGDTPSKLLTLTLKHTDQTLKVQIRRLLKSFAKLRRTKLWKESVYAGAYFVEVVPSKSDGLWHVHLHAILKAEFMPWRELRRLWYKCTGDSHVLRLELIRSAGKAFNYAASYASKGFDRDCFDDPNALCKLLADLPSVRMWATFSGWRGTDLANRFRLQSRTERVCALSDYICALDKNEPWATALSGSLKLPGRKAIRSHA